MQKFRHRLFLHSLTQPKARFILPHILQPSIKVVRDSSDLLFPKNFDQSWHPVMDMAYFKKREIAMLNDAEHCQYVNSIFQTVAQLAYERKTVEACSLLAELMARCNERNIALSKNMALFAEGWVKGNDGPMSYMAAMIGLNDQMYPNDMAIIVAQMAQTLIKKDLKFYTELEPKLIDSLSNQIETYIAAHDYYDEQFLSKILFSFVDILHYNTYLNNFILPDSITSLMSRIGSVESSYSCPFWSQIAVYFHYVFYYYQANQRQNALDALKHLEGILYSLNFSHDKNIPDKSKLLLQGSYIYNKCQLVDLGYSRKIEFNEYAKDLLTQALENEDSLIHELFNDQEHSRVSKI